MAKATGQSPCEVTATLIRAFAQAEVAADYSEDERPAALLLAIRDTIDPQEVCHLGRALLVRDDVLSDPPYRLGGAMCVSERAEIARRLGMMTVAQAT